MLRDRYEPMNLFELVPALGMELDPVLMQLDTLLDDDTLFQTIKADLARRAPRTGVTGRGSTPVEAILRLLVVKHLYGWSYEQTEQWVGDSLVLRQFTRVYAQRVPDATTLIRWANLIQPTTLHTLLDRVVALARQHQLTRGRKLRLDSTVVETNIHHPLDSALLVDGVRLLGRQLGRAKRLLEDTVAAGTDLFRRRARSARRQMQQIVQTARRRGEAAADDLKEQYRRLIGITRQTVRQATAVADHLRAAGSAAAQQVAERLRQLGSQVEQVIRQATRRVLQGEQVPASEKLVSLVEPHTAIIKKGKPGKSVEFGRVIWLAEVEGGIISEYQVLPGNPDDAAYVRPSLEHHQEQFARAPDLLVGDRKLHTAANEAYAREHGVKRVVLPKGGRLSAERRAAEQARGFRRGRNWRAGIEGRISGLKRRHKLNRCFYHGASGMERWVGWGVIAHDLRVIAQHRPARTTR
jgi:IS5 family transposase